MQSSYVFMLACMLVVVVQAVIPVSVMAQGKHTLSSANQPALDKEDWAIVHPVLGVKAGVGLAGRHLDSRLFARLNRFEIPKPNPSYMWFEYFNQAEMEASYQICQTVVGMSPSQVEQLLGRPRYRGGTIDCWNFCKQGEDIWLYSIGGCKVPIRITFRNYACKNAVVYARSEDVRYATWKAKKVAECAVGKSIKDILRMEESSCNAFDDHGQKLTSGAVGDFTGTANLDFGPGTVAELIVLRGRCVKGAVCLVAH